MLQTISEPVTVGMSDRPHWVKWKTRVYRVDRVGFHHSFWQGRTLIHIFSVIAGQTFLKLSFNSESLAWKLEEIDDGV